MPNTAFDSSPAQWDLLKPLAREMRRTPTPAEEALWQLVRSRRICNARFRRQHAIDRFVVDFVCLEARLVVEVDGPIHDRQQEQDAVRENALAALGFRVLRFSNEEVLRHCAAVCAQIGAALEASQTPHPLPSSPSIRRATSGEGEQSTRSSPPLPKPLCGQMERGPGGEVAAPGSEA